VAKAGAEFFNIRLYAGTSADADKRLLELAFAIQALCRRSCLEPLFDLVFPRESARGWNG
jgi:hypothetical protein